MKTKELTIKTKEKTRYFSEVRLAVSLWGSLTFVNRELCLARNKKDTLSVSFGSQYLFGGAHIISRVGSILKNCWFLRLFEKYTRNLNTRFIKVC